MKKMSKVFGAVAISAALVIGTAAPAFAADVQPGTSGDQTGSGMSDGDDTNPIHTDVLAYISDQSLDPDPDQISASVPLAIYIVIDGTVAKQEKPILAPSNYYIKNTGENVLNVKTVKADAAGSWTLRGATENFNTTSDQIKMSFTSGTSTFDLGQASTGAGYGLNLQIAANSPAAFGINGSTQLQTAKTANTTSGEKIVTLTYTLEKVA